MVKASTNARRRLEHQDNSRRDREKRKEPDSDSENRRSGRIAAKRRLTEENNGQPTASGTSSRLSPPSSRSVSPPSLPHTWNHLDGCWHESPLKYSPNKKSIRDIMTALILRQLDTQGNNSEVVTALPVPSPQCPNQAVIAVEFDQDLPEPRPTVKMLVADILNDDEVQVSDGADAGSQEPADLFTSLLGATGLSSSPFSVRLGAYTLRPTADGTRQCRIPPPRFSTQTDGYWMQTMDEGSCDWLGCAAPAGTITNPRTNSFGSSVTMVHLHGHMLWFLWPGTQSNLRKLYEAEHMTILDGMDKLDGLQLVELKAKPGGYWRLSYGSCCIYANVSLSTSAYFRTDFWSVQSWSDAKQSMELHLSLYREGTPYDEAFLESVEVRELKQWANLGTMLKARVWSAQRGKGEEILAWLEAFREKIRVEARKAERIVKKRRLNKENQREDGQPSSSRLSPLCSTSPPSDLPFTWDHLDGCWNEALLKYAHQDSVKAIIIALISRRLDTPSDDSDVKVTLKYEVGTELPVPSPQRPTQAVVAVEFDQELPEPRPTLKMLVADILNSDDGEVQVSDGTDVVSQEPTNLLASLLAATGPSSTPFSVLLGAYTLSPTAKGTGQCRIPPPRFIASNSNNGYWMQTMDESKCDWLGCIAGAGAITDPRTDYFGSSATMLHLHGHMLWFLWPGTESNLKKLYKPEHMTILDGMDKLDGLQIVELKAKPGGYWRLSHGSCCIYASVSLSTSAYIGTDFWSLQSWEDAKMIMRLHLSLHDEGSQYDELFLDTVEVRELEPWANLGTRLKASFGNSAQIAKGKEILAWVEAFRKKIETRKAK